MSDSVDEVLFSNEWIEVRSKELKKYDYKYTYSHFKKSNGKAVAVLPFKDDRLGRAFLLRSEIVPPWGDRKYSCAVTGAHDQSEPVLTAVKELKEETGYEVYPTEMIDLGTCRATKATDTVFHLFGVDLTSKSHFEPETDGTSLEKHANNFWSSNISCSDDPVLYTMAYKLERL